MEPKKHPNETNKQNRNKLVDAENIDSCQKMGKKYKGGRSISWYLQNSHGNINYSIEKIASNIIIMYGV